MKFDFSKSTEADFRNKFQLQLDTMRKNILYITHRVDAIMSLCRLIHNNSNLQTQVDEYFDKDTEDIPEDAESTAEQTK